MFGHDALLYTDLDDYMAELVSFVREGASAGEVILIAVPEPRRGLLRAELAHDRADIVFVDTTESRNPNVIIPAVRAQVEPYAPRPVRMVGEPMPVRSPEERDAWMLHEALANLAFAGTATRFLCAYDVRAQAELLPVAEATHPVIVEGGQARPAGYRPPLEIVAELNRALPEPETVDDAITFDPGRLDALRAWVGRHAGAAAVADIGAAQAAVGEIATNALTHGGVGIATARVWTTANHLVVEIRGAGHITDPLAGRRDPGPRARRGRGLLAANRLVDLILTHTTPVGTVTRLLIARRR